MKRILGILLLASCSPQRIAQAPVAASHGEVAAPAPTERPIVGFTDLPPDLPADAIRANLEGLRRHKAADYERAAERFHEAWTAEPSFALARFNEACALARLGRFDEAGKHLDALFEHDLPQFVSRFRRDADLEELRASPRGKALDAHIAELTPRWARALARGVPSVMWKLGPPNAIYGDAIVEPRYLRVGSYLHAEHRFVPSTPEIHGATSAIFSPEVHQAVIVRAAIAACQYDFCPNLRSVDVDAYATHRFDQEPVRHHYATTSRIDRVDIQPASGAPRVALHDCEFANCNTGWLLGSKHDSNKSTAAGALLSVDYRGSLASSIPPGYSVVKGALVLPDGRRVRLGHRGDGPYTVLVQGDHALVVTVDDGCNCKTENAVFAHRITHVDLQSLRTTQIPGGDGAAAASLGPDGAVYIQRGSKMERWRSLDEVGKGQGESTMPGVTLSVTREPNGNCCGL